jgi:NitT/TauT family transport system substrate-binding protein
MTFARGAAEAAAPTTLRVRLLWHPQPQFAGYLVAEAQDFGKSAGIRLHCQPMRLEQGPIAALLAGEAEFSVASPSHMLESERPEELVMLLAIQQRSALAYPARRAAEVTSVADLRGKRVAIWPGGEDLELRWMLHQAGVASSDLTWLPTADTVAALLGGEVDCAQMTVYHELDQIAHRGGSLADYEILVASGETALLKDGLIARRDWVSAHPAETQAAVEAVLAGWCLAFTKPNVALGVSLAARPDMPAIEQAMQLAKIRGLSLSGATLTHGLGYPDPQHLARAEAAIATLEGRTVNGFIDARFWQAAPASLRPNSW